jgi:SPP1 gp7 family putative phage head morphogenesis protein
MDVLEQLQHESISTELDVIRMEAATRKKVAKLLDNLESDITKELAAADLPGVKMTAYRQARLSALLAEVKLLSSKAYKSVAKAVDNDLMSAAKWVGLSSADSLNGILGTAFAKASLPPAFLEKLVSNTMVEGAPSSEWWSRQTPQLSQKFADQMRLGLAKGDTLDQLIKRVRGTPARAGQMAKSGIMEVQKHQAAAIIRTSMQTITNETRLEVWRQNNDLIKGVRWVSTLDNRTTPICRELDGKGWVYDPAGNLVPEGHSHPFPGPTAHWGCRSVQIPWTKSWSELTKDAGGDKGLAKKLDEVPESTRASMNGQVPKTLMYDAWLKSLPEDQARQALGTAANFRLWQSGKLAAAPELAATMVNRPPRFKPDVDEALFLGSDADAVHDKAKDLRGHFIEFLDRVKEVEPEYAAINLYSSGSKTINRWLTNPKALLDRGFDPAQTKSRIDALDSIFAKAPALPSDVASFSGLQGSLVKQLGKLEIGDEIVVKRYLSSSLSGNTAASFVDEAHSYMQIYAAKGSQGAVYMEHVSEFPRERELLFNRSSRFKLIGKKQVDNRTVYIVELITK